MTPTDAPPDAAPPTIEAIAARMAAITPPPWLLLPPLCGPDGQGVYNEDGGCICEVGDPYPRGDNHPQENMTFIARAPGDIAVLLAEIRRCWAEVYSHNFTSIDPPEGLAGGLYCTVCKTPRNECASMYCAERHKRALGEQQP